MRIYMKAKLLVAGFASLSLAFSSLAVAADPEPGAAATAAAPAAETAAAAAPAAAAPAGTGTVIFFRPSKFVGAAVGYKVREGTTELGKLRNGKYFVLHVAPGTHEYVVHSEAKDTLTLEVEAGQTYYVLGTLGVGILAGRPNLSPSDQASFEAIKGKLKEVAPLTDDKD
jgi:hypothetical protein